MLLLAPILLSCVLQAPQEAARPASPPPAGQPASFASAPGRLCQDLTSTDPISFLVCYPAEDKLRRLDGSGGLVEELAWAAEPLSVTSDANRIYLGSGRDDALSQAREGSVKVFDGAGTLLGQLGAGVGEFVRPADLELHGGWVYVLDLDDVGPGARSRVLRYDAVTWARDPAFDLSHDEAPCSLGLTAAGELLVGELLVGELFGGRVRKYDAAGVQIGTYTFYGGYPGETVRPLGIAADGQGRVYIADAYHGRVQVYDTTGAYLMARGTSGVNQHELRNAIDLVVHPVDGRLFISDFGNAAVKILAAAD